MGQEEGGTATNIRRRVLTPLIVPGTHPPEFDLGILVLHLLLFDKVILRSARLRELPALVAAFGYDGVLELLRSRALELWIRPGPEPGEDALQASTSDLTSSHPAIQTATQVIAEQRGLHAKGLELRFEKMDGGYYEAIRNLTSRFGLSEEEAHKVVEQGLRAALRLNQKISEMRQHEAVAGIGDLDRSVLDARFAFLLSQLSSDIPGSTATRVLSSPKLPDLGGASRAGRVRLERVLEIRETEECRLFREFAWSASSSDEKELQERLTSLRARVAERIGVGAGRVLRFVANTGAGAAAELVAPGSGIAVSFLDAFIVDRLFPRSGLVSFVDRLYPSIFTDQ